MVRGGGVGSWGVKVEGVALQYGPMGILNRRALEGTVVEVGSAELGVNR